MANNANYLPLVAFLSSKRHLHLQFYILPMPTKCRCISSFKTYYPSPAKLLHNMPHKTNTIARFWSIDIAFYQVSS
jgi:hypothetical protein